MLPSTTVWAELAGDLIAAVDEMEHARARVVVLRALPGSRVWSAGHDINELAQPRRDPLAMATLLRNC